MRNEGTGPFSKDFGHWSPGVGVGWAEAASVLRLTGGLTVWSNGIGSRTAIRLRQPQESPWEILNMHVPAIVLAFPDCENLKGLHAQLPKAWLDGKHGFDRPGRQC
jgi:hypothetical protein